MGEVLHGSLLKLLLEHCDFLNIDILQGSVAIATRLRCGGIFKVSCKFTSESTSERILKIG